VWSILIGNEDTNDVYVVRGEALPGEVLIPAISVIVTSTRLPGHADIDPPPGLLD
jgi:ribosomal 30S subunit maturation factor RimM